MKLRRDHWEQMFRYERVVDGAVTRCVARAVCACGAHHDLNTVGHGRNLPPQAVVKKFLSLGWTERGRFALACPACSTRDKIVRLEDRREAMTTKTEPVMRELTPAEKRKIRELLDGNFDDEMGAYLDGWSDDKIAAEVLVPRAAVTKIREDAYGPIRVDPTLQRIQGDIGKLRSDLKAWLKHCEEQHKEFDARLTKLQQEAEEAQRRLAGRR